jgi:hypothetical protein
LKEIYEWSVYTTTIYIINTKNWIRISVIVDALNHPSLSLLNITQFYILNFLSFNTYLFV